MSDPNLAHRWAYTFLRQLQELGVERVFVAPGSRSTVLALQARNLFGEKLVVHFDERGLGFLALGAAKASRKPTCVITTSGTAVANLLPAVIESRYAHVPLIIISADRPPEMQQRGCNQTIDQTEMYGLHAVAYSEILPANGDTPLSDLQGWAINAWQHATRSGDEGAVQVNWMFREPFFADESALAEIPVESPDPFPSPTIVAPVSGEIKRLQEIVTTTTRGVCIVGALETPEDAAVVRHFVQRIGWMTFADSLSQLRQEGELETLLTYGDVTLLHPIPEELYPDTILHIGGRIVSKRISALLGPSERTRVVSLTPSSERFDPNGGVQKQIVAPLSALNRIASSGAQDLIFQQALLARNATVSAYIEQRFARREGDITEPAVLRALSLLTPASHILMLGNSMPIRDFEMFAAARPNPPRTIANRGASGIDGILATACGAAIGGDTPLTLVIGDLSMLHDLNSLALARQVRTPLSIVVINNDGGGIFSLLPVSRTEHFEPLFGTPHGLRFHDLVRGFGIPYAAPASIEDFVRVYQGSLGQPGPTVIEVSTDRHTNAELHRLLSREITGLLAQSHR